MPFTGTVLDHLTKPRPDTRFCTGVLRQTYPAARPPVLPSLPGVAPARSTAPAVMTHTAAAADTPANPAATAAAPSTTPKGTLPAAVADGVSGSGPALSSGVTGTAAGSNTATAAAAHHSTAAQGSEAATQQYEPAFATQRYTPGVTPNPASQQADAVHTGSADQHEGRVTPPVKAEPGIADNAAKPETVTTDAAAHTAVKQESGANAGKQQGQGSHASESHPAQQAATTSSNDAAAFTAAAAAALVTQTQQPQQQLQAQQQPQQQLQAQQQPQQQLQAQQQPQQQLQARQLQAATVLPVAAPTAGQEPVASSLSSATDPWNALDVAWDSDTPPAWPKLVCPWQVNPEYCTLRALRRTFHMQLTPLLMPTHAFRMRHYSPYTPACMLIKAKLIHIHTCYDVDCSVVIHFKAPSVITLQVMEDRGGELRKAKERYRLVSLAARPAT